jgi:hypothetical protein
MPTVESADDAAQEVLAALERFIEDAVDANGGSTVAKKPAHRTKFHWPPHPVSYSYHVLTTDWTGTASFEAHGETFDVVVARTPYGVFGRCESIWHEDRGDTLEEMLANLRKSSETLFQRQLTISSCLGQAGRFTGHIRELPPKDLVRLLYCPDRDVANQAQIEIDTHASNRVFTPALIAILCDRRHPHRRSAQWCVLDLFEDLPSFAANNEQAHLAVYAMRNLLWDAEDDYARTVYKAGVVLGGHLTHDLGAPALIECLRAPSKIGRRSAIHGLFHVVEWQPETKERVVAELRKVAATDPEPMLRDFAHMMARDIEDDDMDHIPEPVFPDEP